MQISKISKALARAQKDRHSKKAPVPQRQKEEIVLPALEDTGQRYEAYIPDVSVNPKYINRCIYAFHDQHSFVTEQYRIMRTNINSLNKNATNKTILLTSSVEDEGKSITSTNYSYTLACDKTKKIVLVDCDLRKGTLSRYFGILPDKHYGIADYLKGECTIAETLVGSGKSNLHMMFRGSQIDNPAEEIDGQRMKQLIFDLRKRYDYVILDAPPVLPVTDACVLSRHVDGVFVVVKLGKTPRSTIKQCVGLLQQTNANVLGCVLTNVDFNKPGYKKYYYYTYENK